MGVGGSVSRHLESIPCLVGDPKKYAEQLSGYCIRVQGFVVSIYVTGYGVDVNFVAFVRVVE